MKRILPLPLLLLLSFPLFAQQQNHEIAVSGGIVTPNGEHYMPAAGVSYNRFWMRSVSTRSGIFGAQDERTLDDIVRERRFTAAYATVEIHPLRGRVVSPRLAAGIASARFSRHYSRFFDEEDDSLITPVGGAGVDFRITPQFLLGAEMLYMPFEPNPRERFSEAINPYTTLASARFRW